MCGDCWNVAMGAPAAAVAARFAWVGYKDRIPFVNRRSRPEPFESATKCQALRGRPVEDPELVDTGVP